MAKTYFPFGFWPLKHLPGWHWPNFSDGHLLYRGTGGIENVDFSTYVGFAQPDAASISLVGVGHDASTRYTYSVRPICGNGWLETPDVSCSCEFETDGDGDWLGNRVWPVEWVDAEVLSGGQVKVRWSYRTPYGGTAPADFGVYYASSGSITPGSPDATETYTADGTYSHTFTLSDGQTYWFAVTAGDSQGVESHLSGIIGPYLADATAPAAPAVTVSTTF